MASSSAPEAASASATASIPAAPPASAAAVDASGTVAAAAVPAAAAPGAGQAPPDMRAVEWWGASTLTPEKMARLVRRRFIPAATEEKEWVLPVGEVVPQPPLGYVVIFARFHERGLAMPPHPFLLKVLGHYGVALHHLTPNGIQQMAIFIAICEGYLGINPSVNIWANFFDAELLKRKGDLQPVAAGCAGIRLRSGRRNDYIDSWLTESNQGWHGDWFYLKNSVPAGFPEFNFQLFEERPDSWWWGCAVKDAKKLRDHFAAFKTLRDSGVSAATVLAAYHARGVAPLMARALPLWGMTIAQSRKVRCSSSLRPARPRSWSASRKRSGSGRRNSPSRISLRCVRIPTPFSLASKPCVPAKTAEERAANRRKNEEDQEASKRRKADTQAKAARHMQKEQRRAQKLREELEDSLRQEEEEEEETRRSSDEEEEWYGHEAAIEALLSEARSGVDVDTSGGGGWDNVIVVSDDAGQEERARAGAGEGTSGGASPPPVDSTATISAGEEARDEAAAAREVAAVAAQRASTEQAPPGAEEPVPAGVTKVDPAILAPRPDLATTSEVASVGGATPVMATSDAAPVGGATPSEAAGVSKRPLSVDAGTSGGTAPKRARTGSNAGAASEQVAPEGRGDSEGEIARPAPIGRTGTRRADNVGLSAVVEDRRRRRATDGFPFGPGGIDRRSNGGSASGDIGRRSNRGGGAGCAADLATSSQQSGEGTFSLDDPAERAAWTVAGKAIDELAKRAEEMAAMARRLRVPLQGVRDARVAKSLHLVEHAKALQEVTRLRSELEKRENALWKMGAEKNQLVRDLAESKAEEKRLRSERNKARDDANRLRIEWADLVLARDKAEEAFQLERDARIQAERSLGDKQARRGEVERQCASLGSEVAELGPLRVSATRVCEFLEAPIPPQGRLPARLEGLVPRVHELEEAAMASGAGTAFAVMRSYYDNLDVVAFVEGFAGWCTDDDMAALATSSAPDGEAFARRFAPAVLPPRELPSPQ
ncbi:hypothetical protein ACP70R_029385 [Stipagrostis hirtigluma subsp. patula]